MLRNGIEADIFLRFQSDSNPGKDMLVFCLVPVDDSLIFENYVVLLGFFNQFYYLCLRYTGHGGNLFWCGTGIIFQYFQYVLQHFSAPDWFSKRLILDYYII